MPDFSTITIADLNAWLTGRDEQAFAYDPATDGELRCTVKENGDLLVECGEGDTYRFRKYPTA